MAFPSDLPAAARLPFGPAHFAVHRDGLPWSLDFGDRYHGEAGAWAQAQGVFLRGNDLPRRWQGRERFVILETGFGLGNNFLATWAAWREDAQRCERLVFLSVEKHPLTRDDLASALDAGRGTAGPAQAELSAALLARWPVLTPGHHGLSFDDARVQLHLLLGDVAPVLRGIDTDVDAFYLDGFAPARNPALWSPEVFRRVARLAAPGATAATWTTARPVREALGRNGFQVEPWPGVPPQREATRAVFEPVHQPVRAGSVAVLRGGGTAVRPVREALVIGAGLAGCAAAWALARQGWRSTLLDRHAAPAQEASGNPGGLMHGIFNAPDSLHARWFRAAALHAAQWAREPVTQGRIAGRLDGFLRLEMRRAEGEARAQLAQVGLPRDWLDWADHRALQTLSGLDLVGTGVKGAWHFRSGGWLSPADCCRWWWAEAQRLAQARWQGGCAVAALRAVPGDAPGWQALDAEGRVLAEAPVIVLATALGTSALLDTLLDTQEGAPSGLRMSAVRGQTTVLPADLAGLRAPLRPVSGQGYALTLPDGQVLCGATSQADDRDATVREADHRHNLARAASLGVLPASVADDLAGAAHWHGRTGWRAVTADRLPVVGPPVDPAAKALARAAGRRLDSVHHRPRRHGLSGVADSSAPQRHGLYVLTGLGSRGLTSAGLAADILASWVTGAPCPVSNELRDALDIARF